MLVWVYGHRRLTMTVWESSVLLYYSMYSLALVCCRCRRKTCYTRILYRESICTRYLYGNNRCWMRYSDVVSGLSCAFLQRTQGLGSFLSFPSPSLLPPLVLLPPATSFSISHRSFLGSGYDCRRTLQSTPKSKIQFLHSTPLGPIAPQLLDLSHCPSPSLKSCADDP